jgi:hypothetical protein
MAREGNELTLAMSVAIAPSIPRICNLYQKLKMIENERGFGIIHDRGVAPVSRRILLRVLCDLELASQGQTGASPLLKELFDSAVATIASFKAKASFDENSMGCLAECAFDLSYFAPPIVSTLFISDQLGSDDTCTACVEALTNAVLAGYHHMVSTNEAIIQVRKTKSGPVSSNDWRLLTLNRSLLNEPSGIAFVQRYLSCLAYLQSIR